jgi:hypothetical protein
MPLSYWACNPPAEPNFASRRSDQSVCINRIPSNSSNIRTRVVGYGHFGTVRGSYKTCIGPIAVLVVCVLILLLLSRQRKLVGTNPVSYLQTSPHERPPTHVQTRPQTQTHTHIHIHTHTLTTDPRDARGGMARIRSKNETARPCVSFGRIEKNARLDNRYIIFHGTI